MSEGTAAAPAQETPKAAAAETTSGTQAVTPQGGAAQTTENKDATQQKPAVPEKYELKIPEGSHLDAGYTEKIASYAKEQGLSNQQAQTLLEREHEAVSSFVQNQTEEFQKRQSAWVNEMQADSEIGGASFKQNIECAKRVVDRFGTEAFKQELNKTGLGNHPELVRVFNRIGKMMTNDQLVLPGSQASGPRSAEDIFYGGSKSS